jgi:hypothetical protein
MRSPLLSVYPSLSLHLCNPLNFVKRFMRSPCSLCVFVFYVFRVVSKESKRLFLQFHINILEEQNACIFTMTLKIEVECYSETSVTIFIGRALAQAVSRWLPTAAGRVRAQVRSCGICGGQIGTGAGFLWVLPFPLPIIISPTAPHSSSIIRGSYRNKKKISALQYNFYLHCFSFHFSLRISRSLHVMLSVIKGSGGDISELVLLFFIFPSFPYFSQ